MQTRTGSIARLDLPNILGGLLLLALFVVLNNSSSGVIRGGDDDGSGIGGTGRMPVPGGESGFGGTGLRPFLGVNEFSEIEIILSPEERQTGVAAQLDLAIAPVQSVSSTPVASQVAIADPVSITRDSAAILISEALQREADINALYFEREQDAGAAMQAPGGEGSAEDLAASLVAVATDSPSINQDTQSDRDLVAPVTEPDSPVIADTQPQQPERQESNTVSWDRLARLLAQNNSGNSAEDSRTELDADAQAERAARPERIQRPMLPPVQRVRPIQRAAILPPRVRPLRL